MTNYLFSKIFNTSAFLFCIAFFGNEVATSGRVLVFREFVVFERFPATTCKDEENAVPEIEEGGKSNEENECRENNVEISTEKRYDRHCAHDAHKGTGSVVEACQINIIEGNRNTDTTQVRSAE